MQLAKKIPLWSLYGLLIYMPLHIFLSQSISMLTGGLEVWKVAKDVLLATVTVFTICLVWKQGKSPRWFWLLVGLTSAYAALHLAVWAAHPHLYRPSALLGVAYNLRVPCLAILGAGAMLVYPAKFTFRSIMRVVLGVSTLVAILGILQYFLPSDILTHVGYSVARGVKPTFFIDDNPAFPRVMSTLRDPNSLGAYLLLPLGALITIWLRYKQFAYRWLIPIACALHVAAIYLTFSRSAWVGTVLVVGLAVWWQYSSFFVRTLRRWWFVGVAALLLLAFGAYSIRNSGVVSHHTTAQVGQYDSNQLHWIYVKRGLTGIWHEPLGHGPGTAGLASIQNPAGGLLTENYYVQVGYEVGMLGLAIFVGLNVWLYFRIWRRHDAWTPVLLASFWAYVLMNMLLHTWSNEAVATQWWALAGVALALPVATKRRAGRAQSGATR